MKLKTKLSYLTSIVLAASTFGVQAKPVEWDMIPEQSQLTFVATQNGSPLNGKFNSFTANLNVDPNDLEHSSIDIIIDINSASLSYNEIKKTLLASDWFNVKMFPKAEFKATQFKKTGDNAYQALGTLTIRDKSLPVTLSFTSTFPDEKTGVVMGSTVLKRTAFGVGQGEWSSVDQVKDDVTVNFKVTATKKQ